jgi:predicted PurR-regulated permease PerM
MHWPSPAARWMGVALLLVAVLLLSALLARPLAKGAFVVLFTAVVMAYIAGPLVETARRRITVGWRRRPLPRMIATFAVMVSLGSAVALAFVLTQARVEGQVAALSAQAPEYLERALDRVRALESWTDRAPVPEGLRQSLASVTITASSALSAEAREALGEVLGGAPHLPWMSLAPVLAFVLLNASPAFRRSAVQRLPEGHLRWRGDEFFGHVNYVLAGYVRAQVIAALFVGTVSAAVFALLKVPYAFSVGLGSGLLEFVPIVGPLTTALVVSMLASGPQLAAALSFLVALRLAQDYVIYPRLLGRGMHLHPVAVVVAIWAGARLGGLVGVLAAVPTVGLASVALRHWREYRAIERLVREHGRLTEDTGETPTVSFSAPDPIPEAAPAAEVAPARHSES